MTGLDADLLAAKYRTQAIDLSQKKLLITNFQGTEQEKDFQEAANCNGFGRIRHFKFNASNSWPSNPLPIQPAYKALGLPSSGVLDAQIFQNAACNLRCWYCFVPFNLLNADPKHSAWLSPAEIIDMYLDQKNRPHMIDLSGGEPSIVPEWIPWMMRELRYRKLEDKVYLWSDDNLTNDYFWKYLSSEDIEIVRTYRNYGKVCCFKGFDSKSFSFNTAANPELFERQFELMKRYVALGIDVYAYVTLTTPLDEGIRGKIISFVDKLQQIDYHLPLRTIPLEIKIYSPLESRFKLSEKEPALKNQKEAVRCWQEELLSRFSKQDLALSITDVPLEGRS